MDWSGKLVKIKQEWLSKDEWDIPYLVLEDREDRVLVQELRQYSKNTFLGTWCWAKDMMYIVDDKFISELIWSRNASFYFI